VAWWLKCCEVTNMAWVRISRGIFFVNIFQNPKKRAGLGLIRVACNNHWWIGKRREGKKKTTLAEAHGPLGSKRP